MQTRIDRGAKTARFHFDSLRELGEYIAREARVWNQNESKQFASHHWDLNAGYKGALDMARNGWIEGAQRVQEALTALPTRTPQPDTRTDVYGFRPHVPRFCAGAPDNMIRHVDVAVQGAGRVLTLMVNVTANASQKAECMANFGVAVAQYVNQLETDGTRVELIAAISNEGAGWRAVTTWTVKGADQPLDLAALAFSIGHPAMLRRIFLAFMERQRATPEMSGYGGARSVRVDDLINAPPGAVALNGMNEANKYAATPQAGVEYVSKQIEAALNAQEL